MPSDIEHKQAPSELDSPPEDLIEVAKQDGVSAAYEAKSRLINEVFQNEIGWGRYQTQLFLLTGLGWAADNYWLQGVAIILPQIQKELNPVRVEFTTLALYVGLILGASTWGILCDVIGRKVSFNITLFIAGVFGIAAGSPDNFVTLASLVGCIGFGIGGNLPVDGAVYLEAIPKSHQWTLTLLSGWWALGQLFASLIAWPLIANFSCAQETTVCPKDQNMGWRYTFYILGGTTFVMFLMRFFVFDLQESPKYLAAKGRDQDAIDVLQHIAKRNGKTITLTAEKLHSAGQEKNARDHLSTGEVLKQSVSSFSLSHVMPLFQTRRLFINTSITILIWGLIGLAYPLFNGFITLYLTTQVTDGSPSTNTTYRNYAIISVIGLPGSIIACLVVDWTRKKDQEGRSKIAMGGRKLTLAVSTALKGIFLFLFTTSNHQKDVLAYSCASALAENAMYGVLYAYTPEVFPAPHRGTGDAMCSAFNRITGILAPVIKIVTTPAAAGSTTQAAANGPIFVSATLFIVSSVITLLLPIETAGKAAL